MNEHANPKSVRTIPPDDPLPVSKFAGDSQIGRATTLMPFYKAFCLSSKTRCRAHFQLSRVQTRHLLFSYSCLKTGLSFLPPVEAFF